jgi:hypothetical protein
VPGSKRTFNKYTSLLLPSLLFVIHIFDSVEFHVVAQHHKARGIFYMNDLSKNELRNISHK